MGPETNISSRKAAPLDLGHPLLPHVAVRVRVGDVEADQEDIGVGVDKRTYPDKVNLRFCDILGMSKILTCHIPPD